MDKFEKEIAAEILNKDYNTKPAPTSTFNLPLETESSRVPTGAHPYGADLKPTAATNTSEIEPVLDMMSMLPTATTPFYPAAATSPTSEGTSNKTGDGEKLNPIALPENLYIVDPNPKVVREIKKQHTVPSIRYDQGKKHDFRKYIKELEK